MEFRVPAAPQKKKKHGEPAVASETKAKKPAKNGKDSEKSTAAKASKTTPASVEKADAEAAAENLETPEGRKETKPLPTRGTRKKEKENVGKEEDLAVDPSSDDGEGGVETFVSGSACGCYQI
jgi:hypothetical protein